MTDIEQNVRIEPVPEVVLGVCRIRFKVIHVDFVLPVEVALVRIIVAVHRIGVIEAELDAVTHAPLHGDVSAVIAGVTDRLVDINLAGGGIEADDRNLERLAGRIEVDSLPGNGIVAGGLNQVTLRVGSWVSDKTVR